MKTYGNSLFIGLAILFSLSLIHVQAHAKEQSQQKSMPAVQMILLTEEKPTPQPKPNVAFVTSAAYTGNLGGLAGADQKCQSLAEAAGLPANAYKAWLSTSSVNAIDRLGAARGWVRVDGKPFADTKEDIAAGKIYHPLRVDENGAVRYRNGVRTGTSPDGTKASYGTTCGDWTSSSNLEWVATGGTDGVTAVYTSSGANTCQDESCLYCFGVNHSSLVTVNPVAGRIAFMTQNSWIPSTGLAAADGLCQSEANSASLSGTFKALLADVGYSAASRFNLSGLPWVRPDSVAIAPTAAELFSADYLNTAICQSADGTQYLGGYVVWGVALDPNTAGTLESTCSNWTSSGSANYARAGRSGYASHAGGYFGGNSDPCNVAWYHLYCLQE